jgi:hypothetical protein
MMKNLKTFTLFESSSYNYTIDDVKKLPLFNLLQKLGFYDSTSAAIWKHGNMRIYNDVLHMSEPAESITIYGNGPVRKTVKKNFQNRFGGTSSQHILKRFNSNISSLTDWNIRFAYLFNWARKRYAKQGLAFDLSKIPNIESYLESIFKEDISIFMSIYKDLDPRSKSLFLKKIGKTEDDLNKLVALSNRASDIMRWA